MPGKDNVTVSTDPGGVGLLSVTTLRTGVVLAGALAVGALVPCDKGPADPDDNESHATAPV